MDAREVRERGKEMVSSTVSLLSSLNANSLSQEPARTHWSRKEPSRGLKVPENNVGIEERRSHLETGEGASSESSQ